MANVILKPGREKSLLRRHPWIFSGAIQNVAGDPASGSTVDLLSSDHKFLARAAYSPTSQIRARVWTFDPQEIIDAGFFRSRIRKSIERRLSLFNDQFTIMDNRNRLLTPPHSDSLRLVYAESDGLPGVIVDRYNETVVMQCLTAGAELWRETIADILTTETGLAAIYERSDADVREIEGLPSRTGFLRRSFAQHLETSLQPLKTTVVEYELKFHVNFAEGHKTGFYLDQRKNRLRVRELAYARDVLDCFCYTGGFTVNALSGGAKSVLSVDSSADALDLCKENIVLNDLPADRHTALEGDVFLLLRKFRDENRSFDMIILDPPKFAPTSAHAEKATRAYKDINLLAFKLLRPGGMLVTFSCSGGVDAGLFQKIVAGAALDAGVEAQIVEYLSQGADHPVSLHFPEGAYLKGLVCVKR